jgi:hypothetical protein
MMSSEVTTISFAVPSEVALEFQARAFALLDGLTAASHAVGGPVTPVEEVGFTPLTSSQVQGIDVWQLDPWTEVDGERALWVVESLPEVPRAVLTHLCRRPDRWVSGADIGRELGLSHGAKSVPPSFKSMANRCRRAGRRPMWDHDAQNGYRVTARVGALFVAAISEMDRW